MKKLNNIKDPAGSRRRKYCLMAFVLLLSLTACGKQSQVISAAQQAKEQSAGELTTGEQSAGGLSQIEEGASSLQEGSSAILPDGEEGTEAAVYVYICGQVRYPGVYPLPAGSRICDAVEAAGGLTEEAAADSRNMAELLYDGEMIYIPTPEEAEAEAEAAGVRSREEQEATASGYGRDGRVNINTASKEVLMTLNGIGEGRAEAIIAYREEEGLFTCTEDLTRVSGIGEALLGRIIDKITVE